MSDPLPRTDPLSADAGALDIARAIADGAVSAVEVMDAALTRVDRHDTALNAVTDLTEARAKAAARAVDAMKASGEALPPLAGVPYAVKNLYDVAGLTTLAGSKIERDKPKATRDAALVEKLDDAGGVLIGALNMDEYAYGFTTENSHYGPARNPHDTTRIAGGSSGGSSAAVAGGLVPVTLGTDTNGSIRVPASVTGLYGLKPTYGRLSRRGAFLFVASFDHVGPFARAVGDLAAVYDALQGPDPEDPHQQKRPVEPVSDALDSGIEDLTIAKATGFFAQGGNPEAYGAVASAVSALGVERTVELPEAARARAAAFLISCCEGGNLHFPNLLTRADDFDPAVRDRLIAGAITPVTWYAQAQRFRRWYRKQVAAVFHEADVIITPATPCPATPIGQPTAMIGGTEQVVRPNLGIYTQPISFIGLPVIVAPIVQREGALPIGVQLIAAPWNEQALFRVARRLEELGVAAAPVAKAFR